MTPTGVASARKARRVLAGPVMAGIAWIAMGIMRRVGVETVERLLPAGWKRSAVTVMRIVAVIHMAIKVGWSVKPWTGANEHPANEPIGPVVSIGCTIIWRIGEVAVGAYRRRPDVDGNLRWRSRKGAQQGGDKTKKYKGL
jgi:hypothetical protein